MIMDINKIVRQCFVQYGYAEGVYPINGHDYSALAERTRKEYKMSPEEYLAGKGLNIKFEIL